MRRITKETLERLTAELPVTAAFEADIEELVAPRLGIITGFQELLDRIAALVATDLDDVPPAGAIRGPRPRP